MRPSSSFIFSQYETQFVPNDIVAAHCILLCLAMILTLVTTGGYIAACENLKAYMT